MRKTIGFLTAIFTFFLGVSLYFVYLNFALDKSKPLVEPVESFSPPLVSLCDAAENPSLFENDNIRVRVRISGWDVPGYSISEFSGNCRADIIFRLTEKSKAETESLFKRLNERHVAKDFQSFIEVEVIGKLIGYERRRLIPFHERFEIEAKEIKQISPVIKPRRNEYLSD